MRILIAGVTGFIGSHLATTLLKEGHQIVGCARNVKKAQRIFPGIDVIFCDFTRDNDLSVWLSRLNGIDMVINAVGIIAEEGKNTFESLHRETPKALFEACAQAGVKRVIQISALGADDKAQSRYHLTKKAADDYLTSLDLDWIILQPSIVYGPGGQSTLLFSSIAALPVILLVGDGSQKLQPIFIDDLIQGVVRLIEKRPAKIKLEAVGPEPATFQTLLEYYREWLGLEKTFKISLPLPVVRVGVWFGSLFNKLINPESLEMLLRGNTGNPRPFEQATGIKPKALKKALEEVECKPADRLFARLYFALPLLRVSVAILWIATGIISAFLYPAEKSYELLAQVGITGWLAPAMLYGASFLDLLLGAAMLANYRIKLVATVQMMVIFIYSAIIAVKLPELWLHPFGPVAKNIPLLAATFLLIMTAEDRN